MAVLGITNGVGVSDTLAEQRMEMAFTEHCEICLIQLCHGRNTPIRHNVKNCLAGIWLINANTKPFRKYKNIYML